MSAEEFYDRFEFNPSMSGSLLGRGGFSSVHKAYDKWRKRYVAIKKSEVGTYAKFDLLREVKLANEVESHLNVIRYENVERISDRSGTYDYAILKYYELGNLDQVLGAYVLTDKERRQILVGILRGLAHLHRIPIIHRDFKAANVLMDRDKDGNWIPVIADFGLSRLVDADRSYVLDNSQIAVTPNYASPEQYGENVALRPNTDLWAFGVMTYKIMTGRLPFRVENTSGDKDPTSRIKEMILAGKLPDDVRNVPEPYRSLILKCLVVDPVKRVKRAEELMDMLSLEKKPEPTPSPAAKPYEDVTRPWPKVEPRRPLPENPERTRHVENIKAPVEKPTRKSWPWQSALLIVSLFFLVVIVSIYYPRIMKRFTPRTLADTAEKENRPAPMVLKEDTTTPEKEIIIARSKNYGFNIVNSGKEYFTIEKSKKKKTRIEYNWTVSEIGNYHVYSYRPDKQYLYLEKPDKRIEDVENVDSQEKYIICLIKGIKYRIDPVTGEKDKIGGVSVEDLKNN